MEKIEIIKLLNGLIVERGVFALRILYNDEVVIVANLTYVKQNAVTLLEKVTTLQIELDCSMDTLKTNLRKLITMKV